MNVSWECGVSEGELRFGIHEARSKSTRNALSSYSPHQKKKLGSKFKHRVIELKANDILV